MKTNIYILTVVLALFFSCKKEEIISFQPSEGITIYKKAISEGPDSLSYSFAVREVDRLSDTIVLPLRITGNPVDRDREVLYDTISNLTTAATVNYELLSARIPAGSYTGYLSVKINRTEDLKTKEQRLWIHLKESSDFIPGAKELETYLIKINDYLTKPSTWDDIRFGEYSQVKYGLIIRETGYFDFSDLHPEVRLFIVQTCRNVLNEYIAEHGEEMLDENQVPVRFP